jgi:hypothetical protein
MYVPRIEPFLKTKNEENRRTEEREEEQFSRHKKETTKTEKKKTVLERDRLTSKRPRAITFGQKEKQTERPRAWTKGET